MIPASALQPLGKLFYKSLSLAKGNLHAQFLGEGLWLVKVTA
jgi:hypothetical protein